MGFKDKLTKYYTDSYMQKYGDRMTQFQGNVISVKVEEKCILWIFHKIQAFLIIKPEKCMLSFFSPPPPKKAYKTNKPNRKHM